MSEVDDNPITESDVYESLMYDLVGGASARLRTVRSMLIDEDLKPSIHRLTHADVDTVIDAVDALVSKIVPPSKS